MRKLICFALSLGFLIAVSSTGRSALLLVEPGDDLDLIFSRLDSGTVIQFSPGRYSFTPKPYRDPTCGNCEAESTQVQATVGLRVSGERIWMLGPADDDAIIETNSGYGIFFDGCDGCTMEGLIITGGERDREAMASDGAIVARNSSVTINNCVIRDNIGDSTRVASTIVGIAGIVGRDGSVLNVTNNRILRNSWDGIVLYRNSQAVIENNFIDGIDLARGGQVGGGRGVGIAATWNAFATIRGNLVRHYWKGIGALVDAQVTAEENIVEHIATWGITLWDAGHGRPNGQFRRNVVFDTGACGASIVRSLEEPPPGHLIQNVFIHTGQDPRYDTGEPYCEQTSVALSEVATTFGVSANLSYNNREPGGQRGREDVEARDFTTRIRPILTALDKWPMLKDSDFWADYGLAPPAPEVPDTVAVSDSLATVADSLGVVPADSAGVAPADTLTPKPAEADSTRPRGEAPDSTGG